MKTKKKKRIISKQSRHVRFLYWLLDIKPKHHTGKVLPVKETSYGLFLFLLLLFSPFAFSQTKAVKAVQTDSGNVNVSATINGTTTPPPTFKPTILSPKPGVTNIQKTTVDGTCAPNLLVKVFRNNIFAGETYCSAGGRFSVLITLFTGRNDIKAINYDQFDQAGPESDTVNVTYQPINSGVNQQKPSNILVEADYYLRQVSTGENVYWTITISGGSAPYKIYVDWGDGNYTNDNINTTGQRIIDHTYNKAGKYNIVITVTDSSNTASVLQVAVSVIGQITPPGGTGTVSECKQNATNIFQSIRCNLSPVVMSVILPIYWTLVTLFLLAWVINKMRHSRHITGGRPRYGHL